MFLLSATQKMKPTWSKQDLVGVATYKMIAAECLCKFFAGEK